MKSRTSGVLLVVAIMLLGAVFVPRAEAQIVTNSLPFSFGYGADSKGTVCFTTTEIVTAGVNTPTNQGAFRFVPTVTGTWFSTSGPRFPDRVFTNGSSYNKVAAQSADFGLTIAGTYTGAVPGGYAASTKLNITELRVRGIGESTFGASTAKWVETTPGQSQTSSVVSLNLALNSNSEYENTNKYKVVSWDPNDVYTPNTNRQTRSFVVTATTAGNQNNVALDGLEIFGTVDVILSTPPAITNGDLVATSMNEDAGPLDLTTLGLAATDQCDIAWAWTNVAGSGPANGSVAVNGTGTNPVWTAFTYTPNTNFNGTNTFDVKVTGVNSLLSDTVTVRVVVNPVSDPPANPVPPAYTGTTFEAMTQWGVDTGTWNDNADTNAAYDGSGLTFAYQWYCSNSPSASAIANATNATYMVGLEWLGSNLNVTVTCSDTGYPGPASTTVTTGWSKVLGAANTPPVILVNGVPADSVSTNMNEDGGALSLTGLGISADDDSQGGPGVTWTNVTTPANGTVAVSGAGTSVVTWASFTYAPNANFNGTNTFVVQAKDAVNTTDSITVTVVVAAINDPPVNTVAPGYTGTRLVGTALTATNGVWNDNTDTNGSYSAANFDSTAAFTYQWWRSANADGSASNVIPGATASTYTLTESDRWKYLGVAVTCTDGNYPAGSASNTAFSAWLREATTPPVYVTTNGTGGGTSWADATSLTNALRICQTSNAIWLAQGMYTNTATFTAATNGITIYGGFTNGMESYAGRDWSNYPAILSGNSNNWRVVTVSGAGVTLDGIVITNSYGSSAGGLTKTVAGALTLANCRVVNHTASHGGGVYVNAGTLLMTNCVVAGNRAWNAGGYDPISGYGIYASGATTVDIVDCLFSNQYATGGFGNRDGSGGVLYFNNGILRVLRTEFISNRGAPQFSGGCVYIGNSATLSVFSNCVFRGNAVESGSGGAMYVSAGSYTANVINCTFAGNTNAGSGGAVYLNSGTMNLKNCILWTNRVNTGGSGSELYLGGGTMNVNYCDLTGSGSPYVFGSPTFANCLYSDPLFASATDLHEKSAAGRWDPATQAFITTDLQYSPCIDAGDNTDPIGAEPTDNGNSRINMGAYGGTAEASKSPPDVAPQPADLGAVVNYHRANISGKLTNAVYCVANTYLCYGPGDGGTTTGGWSTVVSLGQKINGVAFSQWTAALTPATTYHYRFFATNAVGGAWTEDATFLTGAQAPGGGTNVIHVDKAASGAADGSDWPNAYPTIIQGLAVIAGSRTNVWITGGTYTEGAQSIVSTPVTVVGGFAGTETAVSQRALTNALGVVTNYTTINGANSYGGLAITASGTVQLEALKCTNSSAAGGGINKSGTGLLVMNNCQIVGNGKGGYVSAGSTLMTNCLVANNRDPSTSTGTKGIGLYVSGVSTILDLVDCVVSNNYPADGGGSRDGWGGGITLDAGLLRAVRTDFIDNKGCGQGYGGGAVYVGAAAVFSNCVFRGNSTQGGTFTPGPGGAVTVRCGSYTANVVNCTFAFNTNASGGGAVYLSTGTLNLRNSILWTNGVYAGYSGSEIYALAGTTMNISYCDFTGTNSPYVVTNTALVNWGSGILAADPLFVSSTDLHLKSQGGHWDVATSAWIIDAENSPCIDVGDPVDTIGLESRVAFNRRINMGAYGGTAQASRSFAKGSSFMFR